MADDKQERAKAIEAALAQIDKQFGKGSIMRLGSRETIDVPAIPTGAISLDAALGLTPLWTPALTWSVLAIGVIGGVANLALRRTAPAVATA